MTAAAWRSSLQTFFAERAHVVGRKPSLADLCWASGRDARIWADTLRHSRLVDSVMSLLELNSQARVLEVGSGSGYIASELAPRVAHYVGVDVAAAAVRLAARLDLPHASFRRADGGKLPFRDGGFDGAVCYDVFTNLPSFAEGLPIIHEMLRVVRSGGRVLIGSIPDRATKAEFESKYRKTVAELEASLGPAHEPEPAAVTSWRNRLRGWLRPSAPAGQIVSYYFDRSDFLRAGSTLSAEAEIRPVHAENPYAAFRFNVVYRKRAL
jgi:ubiquinone/menaquinone biosynthesis C-methylase UbiE